jgi:Cu(I)/Ag(I) efflux system membrane fusion protein
MFKMREVILGPSLGNSYIVEGGLSEGEEIVTDGAFSVDAAAQLAGKPSMMNPQSSSEE